MIHVVSHMFNPYKRTFCGFDMDFVLDCFSVFFFFWKWQWYGSFHLNSWWNYRSTSTKCLDYFLKQAVFRSNSSFLSHFTLSKFIILLCSLSGPGTAHGLRLHIITKKHELYHTKLLKIVFFFFICFFFWEGYTRKMWRNNTMSLLWPGFNYRLKP